MALEIICFFSTSCAVNQTLLSSSRLEEFVIARQSNRIESNQNAVREAAFMTSCDAASLEWPASAGARGESRHAPPAEARSVSACGCRTRNWSAIALPLLALHLCAVLLLARVEFSLLGVGRALPLPSGRQTAAAAAERIRIRLLPPPTRGHLIRLPRDALRRALLERAGGSSASDVTGSALICVCRALRVLLF